MTAIRLHVVARGPRFVLFERVLKIDGRELRLQADISRKHIYRAHECEPGSEMSVRIADEKLAELGWLE